MGNSIVSQNPVLFLHRVTRIVVLFFCFLFLYWSEMDLCSPMVLFTRNVKKIKSATDTNGDFDSKASFKLLNQ